MEKTNKIAVVLSGCGVYDGAEITESVLTLYALSKNHVDYEIFAPDIEQHHVVNHLNGNTSDEKRNVLVESARIARGDIKPLGRFSADSFDAVIFPGGFGVAKNLCDYGIEGTDCTVNGQVATVITEMHDKKKPIGALCISPVLIARILGDVELTVGQNEKTIMDVEELGAKHKETTHTEVVIDQSHKVVTSPCYMLDASVAQIGEGTEEVVKALLSLINEA